MHDKFILEDHTPVPVDLMTWAKWFETAERHVAKTDIAHVHISTVFLGLNHNWGEGPPLLFETLVFGGPLADEVERYATWNEAEAGHKAMVERVNNAMQ